MSGRHEYVTLRVNRCQRILRRTRHEGVGSAERAINSQYLSSLSLTGDSLTAKEMLDYGMANWIFP